MHTIYRISNFIRIKLHVTVFTVQPRSDSIHQTMNGIFILQWENAHVFDKSPTKRFVWSLLCYIYTWNCEIIFLSFVSVLALQFSTIKFQMVGRWLPASYKLNGFWILIYYSPFTSRLCMNGANVKWTSPFSNENRMFIFAHRSFLMAVAFQWPFTIQWTSLLVFLIIRNYQIDWTCKK